MSCDTPQSKAVAVDGPPSMNTNEYPHPMRNETTTGWNLIFAAWVIASMSTLGALFFGEVMKLPTCVLCWYQRIFMFPLVLILPAGLFPFDRKVVRYALPLVVVGWLIAVFHQLLVLGVIPEEVRPCTQGIPCSQTVIEWFGFLTIPLLSVIAFSTLFALLVVTHLRRQG